MKAIKSALISVFYKDGLDVLAQQLHSTGVQIISTGGTLSYIKDLGIPVTPVEDLTHFPSVFGGRVKTLHPMVFGGILNRRDNEGDQSEKAEHGIENIDMVVVDLYPFEETVASTSDESAIIEKIDIGGIALIRAAAKNFKDVVIVSSRNGYGQVVKELKTNHNATSLAFRKKMAGIAFQTSSHYDNMIAQYFAGESAESLRYGENPHQQAWFEGDLNALFDQVHGKALSYNNLLDTDAAVNLIDEFESNDITFAILKHNNACGIASRATVKEAYLDALAGDPTSAFGGILITNATIDLETAEEINQLFCEVVIAPKFNDDALEVLKSKKNRRLLIRKETPLKTKMVRTVLNGALIQDKDVELIPIAEYKTATKLSPTQEQLNDLHFADKLVKQTKSNAIVLVKGNQLLASGTGQTSRIDALNQAIDKARKFNFDLDGAVMASDAFFPFPDCVEVASKAGIKAVLQPGGSVKDQLTIDYCDEHGIAMVLTGMRHFKH